MEEKLNHENIEVARVSVESGYEVYGTEQLKDLVARVPV